MKLLDKNGRLFGKLSLLDLLILLVLVGGIVGMALRGTVAKETTPEYKSGSYLFEIDSAPEYLKTAYEVGDTLYEAGVAIGTVTDVKVEPRQVTVMENDGDLVPKERKTQSTITLTVETDRMRLEEGIYIDTKEMLNGTSHSLSNGFAVATGRILEIKVNE